MSYSLADIILSEVVPAQGCTEPVAVALAAAAAAQSMGRPDAEQIDFMEVTVDPNIFKNGQNVSIPCADGSCGIELAAALGALAGDPAKRLQVLNGVQPADIQRARALLDARKVRIHVRKERGLFVKVCIERITPSGESNTLDTGCATIMGKHDNLVRIDFNGARVEKHPLVQNAAPVHKQFEKMQDFLATLGVDELLTMLDELDEKLSEYLEEGVRMNMRLAEEGLKNDCGHNIGNQLNSLCERGILTKDMLTVAKILTAAAADARLSGSALPAMSSAGSGTQGLAATLVPMAVKKYHTVDRQTFLRAVCLSHLVCSAMKARMGRLGAMCGCAVAAGAGGAAATTLLMGGTPAQIDAAVRNLLADLTGMICDGAKGGCAIKLATAAGAAVQAGLLATTGVSVCTSDGIGCSSATTMMNRAGLIATKGMVEVDNMLLGILQGKDKDS